MSENLTKLAQKIDFTKTSPEDLNREITEVDKNDEEKDQTKTQQSTLWPWDSVRNKLRFDTKYQFLVSHLHYEFQFSEMRSLRFAFCPMCCPWPRSDTTWCWTQFLRSPKSRSKWCKCTQGRRLWVAPPPFSFQAPTDSKTHRLKRPEIEPLPTFTSNCSDLDKIGDSRKFPIQSSEISATEQVYL
jgi:hypothetical protein